LKQGEIKIMTMEKCTAHSGIEEAIENIKKSDSDQWEHITAIEKALPRLMPLWVTVILMVMSGITGSALTLAGMIVKFYSRSGGG